jgi:hypothetical protein
MIELTEAQQQTIQDGGAVRIRDNGRDYVLVRPEVWERLTEEGYDDGPWTPEEMDRLREESAALLDNYGKGS